METIVVAAVAWWALYRLIVDGSYAIRGRPLPRMQRSRYGMRGYLADVWSDGWQRLADRRRERLARRAAGGPAHPRLAKAQANIRAFRDWWRGAGGGRSVHVRGAEVTEEIHETWWDRAVDRAERKRAGRLAQQDTQKRPAEPDTAPEPATADVTNPLADSEPLKASEPDSSPAPDTSEPSNDDSPNGGQPAAAADEPRHRPQPEPNNRKEGTNDMAEITGLNTAITYANDQASANQAAVSELETFVAQLQANDVGGETIALVHQAMEHQQAAASAMAQAHEALQRHLQVQEAYHANPDAGRKEFVTAE